MEIFKNSDGSKYLVTNYKVMSSTLRRQKNLSLVPQQDQELRKSILLNQLSLGNKFYLIVRDPYDRIESFYKSKFVKAVSNLVWMAERNEKKKWQGCTEPFFPYLGLNKTMDHVFIAEKLAKTEFENVVSLLPMVYHWDPHMRPQINAERVIFKPFRIPLWLRIKFERVFKMEDENDVKDLGELFELDLTQKFNNTSDIDDKVQWTPRMLQIVERIYADDFRSYGYNTRTVGDR
jgi:hypothetical protein